MMESRRVLYVGSLQSGSTALHRMVALQQLNLTVTPFDIYPYLIEGSKLARSMHHRFAWGLAISRLNQALQTAAGDLDVDLVWIDKGTWVHRETLRILAGPERRLVHFAGDSMILLNRSRHFVASIPSYDILITTKSFEVDSYRSLGARQVVFLFHGYDASLYRPINVASDDLPRFASDVCFVGRCEPHYRQRISAVADTGADVAVWGDWHRATIGRPKLRRLVRGSGAWGEDYVKALNATKIGLGLLTKYVPEKSTTRSFEIPACGTFLLAERSTEHLKLFEEGREAEFFGTDGEMKEKLAWYLEHDDERQRIGAAGRAKCLRAGYSYLERMRSAIAMIG
jgi:hypothetical protein